MLTSPYSVSPLSPLSEVFVLLSEVVAEVTVSVVVEVVPVVVVVTVVSVVTVPSPTSFSTPKPLVLM